MSELMVSIRNELELDAAIVGGADLIDVKEPRLGSLGAASPDVWRDVANRLANSSLRLSIALGELTDLLPLNDSQLADLLKQIPARVDFAKVALSGCQRIQDWQHQLNKVYSLLPANTAKVCVFYADQDQAESPKIEELMEFAIANDCKAFLIDTYMKNNGSLFDFITEGQLGLILQQANELQLKTVLAGSLTFENLIIANGLNADVIAVRSAVCRKNRVGIVDKMLVEKFKQEMNRQETNC